MMSVSRLTSLPLLLFFLGPSSSFPRTVIGIYKHDEPMADGSRQGSLRKLLYAEDVHTGLPPKEKDAPVKEESPADTKDETQEKLDSDSTKEDRKDTTVLDPMDEEQPAPEGFTDSTSRTISKSNKKDYTGPMIGVIAGSLCVILGTFILIFFCRKRGNQEVTEVAKNAEETPATRDRSSSGSTQGLGIGSFEDDKSEGASVLSYIKSLSTARAALCGNDDAEVDTNPQGGKDRSQKDPVHDSISDGYEHYVIPTFELDGADEMSLDFSLKDQASLALSGGEASVSGRSPDYSSENAC